MHFKKPMDKKMKPHKENKTWILPSLYYLDYKGISFEGVKCQVHSPDLGTATGHLLYCCPVI
jgi:hypothetical protein